MTNMKAIKRALISSVIALVLCCSMLVGTTFAWFTDSVTSANNKIVAGTLDVSLLLWDTEKQEYVDISEKGDPIFGTAGLAQDSLKTLWEPGKTQVAYLAIENKGTLDLQYKVNISVTDYTKNMYEAMEYAITPNAKDGSGVTEWVDGSGIAVVPGVNETEAKNVTLKAGITHYFALSVHMLEDAGNQYQGGQITFDLNVFATQLASESDSFGNTYDALAAFPAHGVGNQVNDGSASVYEFNVYDKPEDDHNATIVGKVKLPAASLIEGAETTSVIITRKDNVDSTVTVETDQGAMTFDVTVSNLDPDNEEEIIVWIRVGTGYTGLKLFHKDVEYTDANKWGYDGEYVWFKTTSFSPFTIVYDADAMILPPEEDEGEGEGETVTEAQPKAIVTLSGENVDKWSTQFGLTPASAEQKLDAVYSFTAPHTSATVDNSIYKTWLCDYYVKFVPADDSMTVLPGGTITLGGNYGSYGWIGFDNPADPATPTNEWIPLLGTFLGGSSNWTYEAIVDFVGEFLCGVAEAEGNKNAGEARVNLTGCSFVVELRLTNPETSEVIVASSVTYDFGTGSSEIDSATAVSVENAEELQAALDAATGDTIISFANDITGDVEVTQKAGVDLVINGNGNKFTGILTVFGNGRQNEAETLAIQNIAFVAKEGAGSSIVSPDRTAQDPAKYSYSHNVTVEGCTFTDPDGAVNCAAIRHEDGGDKNWTVKNCNVDNTMHSLLQINNVAGKLLVEGCTVNSKNGLNLNCCTNVEIVGCNIDVKGYAVRFGVNDGGNLGEAKSFTFENNTLKSACNDGDAVIMFRASAVDAVVNFVNTTLEGATQFKGNTTATTINGVAVN